MSDTSTADQQAVSSTIPCYQNPPVVERAITLRVPMDASVFESKIETWKDLVKSDYPVDESLVEWLVRMENKEGVPMFDTLEPILKITPQYLRRRKAEGADWGIRCPAGQFTMNMHSLPESNRRYRHLRDEYAKWLPRWMDHFGVENANVLSMAYINDLSRELTPQFFNERGLQLGRVIKIFSSVPGKHESLEPPYDCQVMVNLGGEKARKLMIRVNDIRDAHNNLGMRVTFDAIAEIAGPTDHLQVLELLDWCHERIIERFETVFTDEARQSFLPERE